LDTKTKTATIIKYTGKADEIVIPSTVRNYGTDYSVSHIQSEAFSYSSVRKVTFPAGPVEIGPSLFRGCTNLETVVIPHGAITTIPSDSFYCCTALTSVSLPDSLKIIDIGAFAGCKSLTEIQLPASLHTIRENAFASTNLQKIILPDSLRFLGAEAFQN
jgi:hypothetical protein